VCGRERKAGGDTDPRSAEANEAVVMLLAQRRSECWMENSWWKMTPMRMEKRLAASATMMAWTCGGEGLG
jgi:hypothetical protein